MCGFLENTFKCVIYMKPKMLQFFPTQLDLYECLWHSPFHVYRDKGQMLYQAGSLSVATLVIPSGMLQGK